MARRKRDGEKEEKERDGGKRKKGTWSTDEYGWKKERQGESGGNGGKEN